jgi:2-methylisocitrate lyase-like PEP mutase family enzyme
MTSQREMARKFLAMHHEEGPLVVPNPWDAGSARMLIWLGFKALATTSSGFAATRGVLDGAAGRDAVLAHAASVVASVPAPVTADLEDGFAAGPDEVAETYRAARETGLAGASIEDYDPAAGALHDIGLARERVAAAAEVFHGGEARLVLTGRAENFFRGPPDLDDTIIRLQAYQEAGADVLFAPGLTRIEDIRTVVGSVDRPVNVLMRAGGPSVAELGSVGVARVSIGGALAFAALGAATTYARELLEQGTCSWSEQARAGVETARQAFG